MLDDESDEEENFHFLGTPLDPITEDEKNEDPYSRRRTKPVPVHEQRVLDERGRPLRFHGAFQGGFSAGHFNTVADPEGRGFTPGVFVSRRKRQNDGPPERKRARPEDFMDEEDFNEFGIAPRTFHTNADFENTAARSTNDIVMDIVCPIRPIKSSIAIRLMRRFGWREGQSVGAARGRQIEEAEADEEAELALLASDAASLHISFVPKTNTFGLGYSGIDPRSALFGGDVRCERKERDPEVLLGQRGRRGIRGQAFGVSVLEDDDDDVYGQPSLKDYDWEIGGPEGDTEEKGADLHGWTAPRDRKSPQKKPLGYVGKVIKGFRVGPSLTRAASSRYPAPFLPAWYVPIRGANKGLLQDPEQVPAGEEPNSGPGNSVFDFISREDRVRLELAKKKAEPKNRPPELGSQGAVLADLRVPELKKEKASGASRWSRWDSKPSLPPPPSPPAPNEPPAVKSEPSSSSEATSALSDSRPSLTIHFRPFAKDKEKQERFERFCRSHNMQKHPKEAYAVLTPAHFTEWEAQREEEEFVKAARIFRPQSSVLASRFHRGEDIQLCDTTGAITSIPLPPEKKERSSRELAAEAKRFGAETRRSMRWHPHPLLCRRFNVPEPFPGSDVVGLEGSQPKRSDFSIFDLIGLGSRDAGGNAAQQPQAIEAPPVMSREEIKKKRKSVFACLYENPPSTSGNNDPASTTSANNDPSSANSATEEPTAISSATSAQNEARTQEHRVPEAVCLSVESGDQMTRDSGVTDLPSASLTSQDGEAAAVGSQEEQRIPLDIFKAIFADSEESEEEEEEQKEEKKEKKEERKPLAPSRAMAASSLFRHLFEEEGPTNNNSGKPGSYREEKKELPPPNDLKRDQEPSFEKSFGAALPPDLPSKHSSSKELSSNEFLLRLAAGELSSKTKKTKKKKEKHRKHSKASKKTKKKKKKYKKEASSTSSEGS